MAPSEGLTDEGWIRANLESGGELCTEWTFYPTASSSTMSLSAQRHWHGVHGAVRVRREPVAQVLRVAPVPAVLAPAEPPAETRSAARQGRQQRRGRWRRHVGGGASRRSLPCPSSRRPPQPRCASCPQGCIAAGRATSSATRQSAQRGRLFLQCGQPLTRKLPSPCGPRAARQCPTTSAARPVGAAGRRSPLPGSERGWRLSKLSG